MTENIRRVHLHQNENGVGPATINRSVLALRFLFIGYVEAALLRGAHI